MTDSVRGRVFWKHKEKDRRTKRRTSDLFLKKGVATVVELPCLRKMCDFFFLKGKPATMWENEMSLAILENKIKAKKRGEDLEAKVFDRMLQ
jgi:hypothetical protein